MGITATIMNPIEADLTLPQTFNVGIYQRLWGALDRFAVMADYSFTCWNAFDELDIKNSNNGQTVGGEAVHETGRMSPEFRSGSTTIRNLTKTS